MDWAQLAHNRWVWLGGAGAAGLGAVAWYRRKKSGTAGAGATPSATSQSGTYTPGGVGYYDSTGNDVAAQLSQYGQAVDQQLAQAQQASQAQYDAFTAQVQSQIGNIPTTGGPTNVALFGQPITATNSVTYISQPGETFQSIYNKTNPTFGGQGIGAGNLYLLNAGQQGIPSGMDQSYAPPAGTKILIPINF